MLKVFPFLGAALVYEKVAGWHGFADLFTINSQTDSASAWAVFTFLVLTVLQIAYLLIQAILEELRGIRSAVEKIAQNSN